MTAFSPAEYLRDELRERGWTESEFAELLGWSAQEVSELLSGKHIDSDTAFALGEVLGTSAEMWAYLQAAFDSAGASAAARGGSACRR